MTRKEAQAALLAAFIDLDSRHDYDLFIYQVELYKHYNSKTWGWALRYKKHLGSAHNVCGRGRSKEEKYILDAIQSPRGEVKLEFGTPS